MKKSPLFLSLYIASLLLCSCSKEINLEAEAPKWDVQTCDRCKMLVSDKKFSAQVVNPTDGKHFFFDDLGCALMWLQGKEAKEWKDKALIYATDPRNGTWLNIKENELVSGYVTPMAYGIAVLPKGTKPEAGKKVLTFQETLSEIEDVSKQKAAMKMHKH